MSVRPGITFPHHVLALIREAATGSIGRTGVLFAYVHLEIEGRDIIWTGDNTRKKRAL
jgi:4-aminobutyrate aminotransferase-like enzyme